jgi:hypothetical protein
LAASYETLLGVLKGSKKGRKIGYVKKDQPKAGDEKKSSLVPKFMAAVGKAGTPSFSDFASKH